MFDEQARGHKGGDYTTDSGDDVEIRVACSELLHSHAIPQATHIIEHVRSGSATTSVTECVSHLCPSRRRPFFRMFGCWILVVVTIVACLCVPPSYSTRDAWEKPGCHKVGHTRKISIPGCVEFHMTTNACRGFCESWAIPSGPKGNPEQPVTSVGQCCNIMDTEDVEARVLCVDGVKTLTFKSATSCSCYHCKKD